MSSFLWDCIFTLLKTVIGAGLIFAVLFSFSLFLFWMVYRREEDTEEKEKEKI